MNDEFRMTNLNGTSTETKSNAWPHCMAVLLVCATFPLIWVGGLVTSYDAGMAVPDWPGTYGYNLLLYPWTTWFFGPWDLFIEHGHRLLGATAGILTIGLLITVFRNDDRIWLRNLSVATFLAVLLQGGLGGARVLMDDGRLAMVHGIVGPAFFALCVAMAVFTSRWWQETNWRDHVKTDGSKLQRLAVLTTAFVFIQLMIGAHLRHLPASASPTSFRITVFFHLLMAIVLTLHVIALVVEVVRRHRSNTAVLRPTAVLGVLFLFQLALGSATWIVKLLLADLVCGLPVCGRAHESCKKPRRNDDRYRSRSHWIADLGCRVNHSVAIAATRSPVS